MDKPTQFGGCKEGKKYRTVDYSTSTVRMAYNVSQERRTAQGVVFGSVRWSAGLDKVVHNKLRLLSLYLDRAVPCLACASVQPLAFGAISANLHLGGTISRGAHACIIGRNG